MAYDFNFLEEDYVQSNTIQFGLTYGSSAYQVWTDDLFVYSATNEGLKIISQETEEIIAVIEPSTYKRFTSVWSDNEWVYIGTTASGVKRIARTVIEEVNDYSNLITSLEDFIDVPWITSSGVRYIHGNDKNLILCTEAGVDIVRRGSMYASHTLVSGTAYKCFVTPNDYYYYTVSGTDGKWSIHRLNGNSTDWEYSDVVYTTGSGFLAASEKINDIFITEGVSDNFLFVATDNGVFVYDENTSDVYHFTDTNNNFSSVWADLNSSLDHGRLFMASSGPSASFIVLNLEDKSISDIYSISVPGNYEETLDREDIIDINVR